MFSREAEEVNVRNVINDADMMLANAVISIEDVTPVWLIRKSVF